MNKLHFWKFFNTNEWNINVSANIQMGAECALYLLWPGEISHFVYITNSSPLVKTRWLQSRTCGYIAHVSVGKSCELISKFIINLYYLISNLFSVWLFAIIVIAYFIICFVVLLYFGWFCNFSKAVEINTKINTEFNLIFKYIKSIKFGKVHLLYEIGCDTSYLSNLMEESPL
jgi:hypothetical protein